MVLVATTVVFSFRPTIMDHGAGYLMFSVLCLVLSGYKADDKYETILSRKRRYVVFPEGSTFSVSIAAAH